MRWTCVHRASGPAEAWLLRDWLERNGLQVRVTDHLQGARGEVPVFETWPSVWVPEADRDAAALAIASFTAPRLVHPPWTCTCGEPNDANFGSCWQCGADGPAIRTPGSTSPG